MKLLTNIKPISLKKKDFLNLLNNGYNTFAMCDSEEKIKPFLCSTIMDLLSEYQLTVYATGDEKILSSCFSDLKSDQKNEFPMKSKALLTYQSGIIIASIDDHNDITRILDYWGKGIWITLVFHSNDNDIFSLICDNPYRFSFASIIEASKIILNQSGDDDEVEVIFKTSQFKIIKNHVLDYVDKNLNSFV